MLYLLDTNICVYIIKHKPPHVRERFASFKAGDLGVSAVTEAELLYGAYSAPHVSRGSTPLRPPRSRGLSPRSEAGGARGAESAQVEHKLAAVLDFTSRVEVVPFDTSVSDAYGHIRADLERRGTPIGALDLLIAATALALGVPLVTHNAREFEQVPRLRVEDWTLPPTG